MAFEGEESLLDEPLKDHRSGVLYDDDMFNEVVISKIDFLDDEMLLWYSSIITQFI